MRCLFDNAGIQYYAGTEVIAWSGYAPSASPENSLFSAWRNSSLHWGILMSSKYNYIGLGAGYKSSRSRDVPAGLLTESRTRLALDQDQQLVAQRHDGVLELDRRRHQAPDTHGGLKSFDVQYRVDGGAWTTVKDHTTAKSLTLTGRAHGHWYGLRVRSRDNMGIVAYYTWETRVWVP